MKDYSSQEKWQSLPSFVTGAFKKECITYGNQRFYFERNQEIKKSRNQEIKKSRNTALILIGLEREQTLMVSGCLLLPLDAGG
ncbi:TPA: hypothetical protein ACP43E_003224 [Klebsiella pneumoniae]